MTAPARPSGWFVTGGPGARDVPRVYFFAHAGGDPRSFLAWQSELGDEAQLAAVCPPGRGHRAAEPRPTLEEFADGAAAAIRAEERDAGGAVQGDRPVYLFGHSLGGLVAFETARRLRDLPTLRHLFVSGISAPVLAPSQRVRDLAALEGKEFAEQLGFFEGLPPEVMAHEELLDLLLPGVIADFRMAAGYRYRSAAPLEVEVSLIAGRDDAYLHPDKMRGWNDECRTPPALHWVDGGHFYFRDKSPKAVTDLLLDAVRADRHIEVI
ncbi:thioesterase II family protein [Streptomyces sporangiiformans]|uniref:Thioesterase n=1 Tax=Streptomyces sporangiiformans TaxID=2315329 RepID=A0A505DJ48_9ACTN|nr:alpha/beta fold hydrolase [Streptomyces sporangiiformans]TPQ20898.1 thioesterase [Streptomyces sporangiiformans]